MSFDDATTKCEELGKRLCTKDELVSEICCGTGGMCNKYEVWSSTPFAGKIYHKVIVLASSKRLTFSSQNIDLISFFVFSRVSS